MGVSAKVRKGGVIADVRANGVIADTHNSGVIADVHNGGVIATDSKGAPSGSAGSESYWAWGSSEWILLGSGEEIDL